MESRERTGGKGWNNLREKHEREGESGIRERRVNGEDEDRG